MRSSSAQHAVDTFPERPVRAADRGLYEEVRNLTNLVGELTMTLVVQGAYLSAIRHHRSRPIPFDVDEAISLLSDSVPDDVADGLWQAREQVLARLDEQLSMT